MFLRLLDIAEMRNEKKAARANKPFKRVFANLDADKTNGRSEQHLRWHRLRSMKSKALLELMRKPKTDDDPVGGVFAHLKGISGEQSTFGEFMKDAQFIIVKPQLLLKAMELGTTGIHGPGNASNNPDVL